MGIFSSKSGPAGEKAGKPLKLTLEHNGSPLYELNTDEYAREIVIGRSPDCQWHLDHIDHSASAKHAMISRRKNNFYLTDLGSRNGIYFQNRRIQERKLEIGDRIGLGECLLTVQEARDPKTKTSRFHRLVYTDEKGKKIIAELSRPRMVIGSAPDCDIVLQDTLISSKHAELQLKSDGSCWIRDAGSRNGTSVNGDELMADSERMLQDNDVISIAYLDLRFWDAAGDHQESRIWPAVIAVAITVAVILGGYIGYGKLTPNAPQLIEIANREMQAGRLDSAKKILMDSVPYAENAADVQYQRDQLLRRIEQWKNVQAVWKSVQQDLKDRYFNRAAQMLGGIGETDMNSWTWPGGAVEKKKAAAVKRLLDACSATDSCLKSMTATVNDVERIRRELRLAISDAERIKADHTPYVVKYARPYLTKLEKTLDDDKELQQTLLLLSMAKPDYQAIIRRLDKISRESDGPVKIRADRILPAVTTLNRETLRTLAMVDKVCEMDFKTVQGFSLDLPEGIDYSSEKNIGTLRNQLIETVTRFKDTALQLSIIHAQLVAMGVTPGRTLEVMDSFRNAAWMDQVYRVDSLDMPFPRHSRQEPAGFYDRLLGVEFFYDYLGNVHTRSLTLNPNDLPFKPELLRLKAVLIGLDRFITFSDKDENQWFNRNAFADYLRHCKMLLSQRDKIAADQLKRPAKPGTREHLISRGIAAYLLPDGKIKRDLEADIGKSFALLKRNILLLNREFNLAMPEDAVVIRAKIIRTGLPGDSIVRKMWMQRPSAGWGDKK